MAEALGLVLSAPSLVVGFITYGQFVVGIYNTFKNFKTELDEWIIKAEGHWTNLEYGVRFFDAVEKYVEKNTRLYFQKLVTVLHGKLQVLGLQLDNISKKRKTVMGRVGFVFQAKNSLKEAVGEFVEWHNLIQPLLMLLARAADPRIEQKIYAEHASSNKTISTIQNLKLALEAATGNSKSTTFPHGPDFYGGRQRIPNTSVELKRLRGNGNHYVLIDSIPCQGSAAGFVLADFRNLATVLKAVDPMAFGIPTCAGVVKLKDAKGHVVKLEMVFNVPQELNNPRSLRNLLLEIEIEKTQHPINVRIELAKRLARTVLFVHTAKFVHKNFRPETIIVFDQPRGGHSTGLEIGIPFLIGFQKVRLAGGPTVYMGDSAWEQNIYRHPERQGEFLEQSYEMQHDIYSLGVCLLEIALWKSFVRWDVTDTCPMKTVESERILRGNKSPWDTKKNLVQMAQDLIPRTLGNRYAEVTISCLKCLDLDGDNGREEALLREEGMSVGASYIEKILGKLESIAV